MVATAALKLLPAVATSNLTVWHIMEPKHTGLDNKNAGDFLGDVDFIMHAIARDLPGNTEAKIIGNVIEQAEVQVTGWTDYQACSVCDGRETEPCVDGYWCVGGSQLTEDTLPGAQHYGDAAMWYSFPAVSKGHTWTATTQRRISAECLVQIWRGQLSGGCADCGGQLEGECIAKCIGQLTNDALKAGWDFAFSDTTACPDMPLPTLLDGSDKLKVWHIMEAAHFGLENKDAGDFLGDVDFIMHAIARDLPGNKEAKVYGNVIEQAEVQVEGWTDYQPCNVCDGTETDPCVDGYWCVGSANFTQDTLPGKQHYGDKAMWYSFPAASSGLAWRETLERRISAECLVQVWRADAGGCNECDDQLEGECLHKCISKLDTAALQVGWDRAFANATLCSEQPPPNVTVWHIMDAQYTGLGNKDSGDFLGDVDFIMVAIGKELPGDSEAKIYGNVIEQVEVQVTGWTDYQPCNECDGMEKETCTGGYWCVGSDNFTKSTLPGKEHYGAEAMWYSFPAASEGETWNATMQRRISAECLVSVWREAAGGCSDCDDKLEGACLAKCLRKLEKTSLKAAWDKAFANKTLCPDQPLLHDVVV